MLIFFSLLANILYGGMSIYAGIVIFIESEAWYVLFIVLGGLMVLASKVSFVPRKMFVLLTGLTLISIITLIQGFTVKFQLFDHILRLFIAACIAALFYAASGRRMQKRGSKHIGRSL